MKQSEELLKHGHQNIWICLSFRILVTQTLTLEIIAVNDVLHLGVKHLQ